MTCSSSEQRLFDSRPDLGFWRAQILEPERDLVLDEGHHDLVLGVLEDRRDRSGKVGGPH
jgi:hypothetical protein